MEAKRWKTKEIRYRFHHFHSVVIEIMELFKIKI